jgi:hypothetical protein
VVAATAGSGDYGRMREVLVLLRPIEGADLEQLGRLDIDPEASVPFLWYGFPNPHARRRRWEEDGFLGRDPAAFVGGCWRDMALYARLRGDPPDPPAQHRSST